jgi:hypothetical protein
MNKYIVILIILFLLFWKKATKNNSLTPDVIDAIKDDAVNNTDFVGKDEILVFPMDPGSPQKPPLALNIDDNFLGTPIEDAITNDKPLKPKGQFQMNNDVV